VGVYIVREYFGGFTGGTDPRMVLIYILLVLSEVLDIKAEKLAGN